MGVKGCGDSSICNILVKRTFVYDEVCFIFDLFLKHINMKRLFSTLATSSLLFSLMAPQVSGQGVTTLFNDVDESNQNFEAIEYLKNNSIVEGYENGNFEPSSQINRAEFIKIATLMIADQSEADECISAEQKNAGTVFFGDVAADSWFAPYVCLAGRQNLVKGYEDGTFRPARDISFAEASKIILKIYGHDTDESGEKWYTNYARQMEILKAIPMDIEGPHTAISRAQMSEMVWRIDEKITDQPSQTFEQLEAAGLPTPERTVEVPTEPFPAIASCVDLTQRFQASYDDGYYGPEFGGGGVVPLAAPSPDFMREEAVGSTADAAEGDGDGDADYSKTNVQVDGVDEADIVKTDGEYIYFVRQDTVRILKASPVANMVELSKLSFKDSSFYPNEIYVTGNKLIVVGNTWQSEVSISESREILPYEYGHSRTKVFVVDVSDRSNPTKLREVSIQGDYSSSRRIGDYVYMVMNKYPGYYGGNPAELDGEVLIPRISDSANGDVEASGMPMVGCTDIHYFPGYSRPNYLIVAGIPIDSTFEPVESEVMLGSSENIYSSLDNLYVASTEYNYGFVDPDPLPVIIDSADDTMEEDVVEVVEPEDREKTVVYKFNLDEGKVKFDATGKVPGTILNQFSMDESQGYFRIATTKGDFWDETNLASNNVYVLDDEMKIVGQIEDIAPGERIFSTRFIGKRLYMVTFKNIDPLFVIDLADPKNPKILGKLKIPGYSDYLHPYDENHIIGFGKDAVEAKEEDGGRSNFAWYQGMKMAIFDVSNVEEPKEKFVEIIGDRGTESDLLWNHKALLFDKERNLLAFPISVAELTDEQKNSGEDWQYGSTVFQGAHVYNIDLINGFTLRGEISHYDDDSVYEKSGEYFYGDAGLNIKRILRIGDYLYTVSDNMIKASDSGTTEEENRVTITN